MTRLPILAILGALALGTPPANAGDLDVTIADFSPGVVSAGAFCHASFVGEGQPGGPDEGATVYLQGITRALVAEQTMIACVVENRDVEVGRVMATEDGPLAVAVGQFDISEWADSYMCMEYSYVASGVKHEESTCDL